MMFDSRRHHRPATGAAAPEPSQTDTIFDPRPIPPVSNSCNCSRAITDGATLPIGLLLSSVHRPPT
jgi:hypothetical protein